MKPRHQYLRCSRRPLLAMTRTRFAALNAKLKEPKFDAAKQPASIAIDPKNPEELRLQALRDIAREFPHHGSRCPSDDALRKLLEQFDSVAPTDLVEGPGTT